MLCYKDMTFCSNKTCVNKECRRHSYWAESCNRRVEDIDIPTAFSDFHTPENPCPAYKYE